MQAGTTLNLPGIFIPFQWQLAGDPASQEKPFGSPASRIHQSACDIAKGALAYDGKDITGTLESRIHDSTSILQWLHRGGGRVLGNMDADKISIGSAWEQLKILANDLRTIASTVLETAGTEDGKKRWGDKNEVSDPEYRPHMTIATGCEKLQALAGKFDFAVKLISGVTTWEALKAVPEIEQLYEKTFAFVDYGRLIN